MSVFYWFYLQQVRSPQLGQRNAPRPAAIDGVENSRNHRVHIARMELGRLLQEGQPRMCVDDVLHHGDQILGQYPLARFVAARHYVHKTRGGIVAEDQHPVQQNTLVRI